MSFAFSPPHMCMLCAAAASLSASLAVWVCFIWEQHIPPLFSFPSFMYTCMMRGWGARVWAFEYICWIYRSKHSLALAHAFFVDIALVLVINTCVLVTQLDQFSSGARTNKNFSLRFSSSHSDPKLTCSLGKKRKRKCLRLCVCGYVGCKLQNCFSHFPFLTLSVIFQVFPLFLAYLFFGAPLLPTKRRFLIYDWSWHV